MLKLKFEALQLNIFEPSLRAHTHSDPSSTNTQCQKTMDGFIVACIELYATGQNSLSHWIWLPVVFKKKSRHTHQNQLKQSPVSEGQPTPSKNMHAFPG